MTTATQTDRAAIGALARELTDEQWGERFAELDRAAWNPGTRVRESTRAMLAYLDEVWAGLSPRMLDAFTGLHEWPDGTATSERGARMQTWDALEDRDLMSRCVGPGLALALTPLGRAVLKRQEMKR